MPPIRSFCVYCGSAPGGDPAYREAASALGSALAEGGIGLVFGGGRIGLMGVVADAVMAGGGQVTGVIPGALRAAEVAHQGLTELIIVSSMHERKQLMADRADAFAVMPGGIGTLDEMFEIVTWKHLGLHDKPIFVVDIAGYWEPLVKLLDHLVAQGFARPLTPGLVTVLPDVAALMAVLTGGNA